MNDRSRHLGDALRALRQRRDLTAKDLATALGTFPSVVSRWEAGGSLSMTSFLRLAEHLDLHLGDLDDALADVGGWPRKPRAIPPPRTPAEVELLLDALLGAAGPDDLADPSYVLRESLRPLLLLAGKVVIRRDGEG